MRVIVGTIESNSDGFNRIAEIAAKTKGAWLKEIELDFSPCKFFDANMTAPLYAVIARLRDELNDVSVVNMPEKIIGILRKNSFLNVFNVPSLTDTNQTTLPFKIFKLGAGEQFNDYLDIYMKGKGIPDMSVALTRRFRQSLFEIFFNAAIHSDSAQGIFVCGQFYPQKQRLDFTVADAGVGIRDNVRRYTGMAKLDSCKAIEWAMAEGNTTKTQNQPGGLGLKLIKDFIQLNKGKIQIVSRFGYYDFSTNCERVQKIDYDFPGTCINIEINTTDQTSYCLTSELRSEDIF